MSNITNIEDARVDWSGFIKLLESFEDDPLLLEGAPENEFDKTDWEWVGPLAKLPASNDASYPP